MCRITNTPVESVKLLEKIKTEGPRYKNYEFNGRVSIKKDKGMSFLQAVLVGIAQKQYYFFLIFILNIFLFGRNVGVNSKNSFWYSFGNCS